MVRRCAIMENRRYESTITPEYFQGYTYGSTCSTGGCKTRAFGQGFTGY